MFECFSKVFGCFPGETQQIDPQELLLNSQQEQRQQQQQQQEQQEQIRQNFAQIVQQANQFHQLAAPYRNRAQQMQNPYLPTDSNR